MAFVWSVLIIPMLSQVNAEEWTEWLRPNGLDGTVHTLASSSSNDYITEICVRDMDIGQSTTYVQGIKATFASGETTGWIGGSNSAAVDECFSLNAGDCIDDIYTRAGGIIDGLQFTTSDGDVYGEYGNLFGGSKYTSTAVDGECLLKFEVQVSDAWKTGSWISKIRYYFGALPAHCAIHGCDDQLTCNAETGECQRDCDILHIDEFLDQCSSEWDSNAAALAAMDTSITTNTADIATVTASVATNTANIAANSALIASNDAAITSVTNTANTNTASITTNTADIAANTASTTTNAADIATNSNSIETNEQGISSNSADITTNKNSIASNAASITAIETEGISVESRLSAVESTLSRLAIVSAHSAAGNVDAATDLAQSASLTVGAKDVAIFTLGAVNLVLLTSMAVVCCRKQRGSAKYEAVSIASD